MHVERQHSNWLPELQHLSLFSVDGFYIDGALDDLNPFAPRVRHGNTLVVLRFESVDEIVCCDHSNETSSAVLSHGTIYI